MKAILISIRPEWVAKILNGEKTIEIRKRFQKDYVGWVYIYCTKARPYLTRGVRGDVYPSCVSSQGIVPHHLNSRVVARFWCNKVEEHKDFGMFPYSKLRCNKATCLDEEEIEDYGFIEGKGFVPLYAIHIAKLEIFDKPKELKEFHKVGCEEYFTKHVFVNHPNFRPIYESELKQFQFTRAPQSWCYIEE